MQKIAIGLSALLLIAAASKPGAAQAASTATPQKPAECVAYEVAEYPGCVNYGTLSEEQARTARGHPQISSSRKRRPRPGSRARRPIYLHTPRVSSRPRANSHRTSKAGPKEGIYWRLLAAQAVTQR